MPSIHKLPLQVNVTCSPDELRKLADKMEEKIAKTSIGEDTLVEGWIADEVEIKFYFDQEAAALIDCIEVPIDQLRVGDILICTEILKQFTNVAVTVQYPGWHNDMAQCWTVKVKEFKKAFQFSDRFDKPTFRVRRKR